MRATKILMAIVVATSLLVGATGTVLAGGADGEEKQDKKDEKDKKDKESQKDREEKKNKKGGNEKVTICHYPPGNPDNPQTITVGASAVDAHVENHGDTLGPCGCDK